MQDFRKLNIWSKAIEVAELTYELSNELPSEEKFGMTSQMRRSAISISSNIAEGAGRNSLKEFSHFISIAQGSCFELMSQAFLCTKLKLTTENTSNKLIEECEHLAKMISSFKNKLTTSN